MLNPMNEKHLWLLFFKLEKNLVLAGEKLIKTVRTPKFDVK